MSLFQSGRKLLRKLSNRVRSVHSSSPASHWGCSSSGGWRSISSFSCLEAPLVETPQTPPEQALPGAIEEAVARTERQWLIVILGMFVVMLVVIIATGIARTLHPPSNVETIDPLTLHLRGEFVESNLGTALEPDGSATVRVIAQQYSFVPSCLIVPADTPVKFRLTSPDTIHGFLLGGTNVNTMVVPGFVSEVRTRFATPGDYQMPCNEFCGFGHQGMWARVTVVIKDQFPSLTPLERTSCAPQ
jgi:cytochrome c oxidase subunit 2